QQPNFLKSPDWRFVTASLLDRGRLAALPTVNRPEIESWAAGEAQPALFNERDRSKRPRGRRPIRAALRRIPLVHDWLRRVFPRPRHQSGSGAISVRCGPARYRRAVFAGAIVDDDTALDRGPVWRGGGRP